MTTSMKFTGKARSVPVGMAISSFISMLITIISSVIIAYLLNNERISWEQAGYWIMGMLFTASFIGGKSAIKSIKRQRILISMMAGMLYWGVLICLTALFFGGDFSAIGETAGIVLAGCATAALISMPTKNKRSKKTKYGSR